MNERWTNWSGAVSCAPHAVAPAHDEAEIAAIVHVAGREGRTVRPLGSGHSSSPLCVADDGVLLSLERWKGVEAVDPASGSARVRAGSVLQDLGRELFAHGLALHNLGDVDRQSLAGALATGTHGTGRTLANLSSAVTGVRFVRADGELAELDAARPADAELLRAARVSLGVLGVVTAVTLRVVPAARVHERIWRVPLDEALARLEEWSAATRHFELFYYPKRDVAECKAIHPTDAAPESAAGREGERIGWSHEILPSVREEKFHEMEYSVPAAIGPACFREMAARLRARHPEVSWPLEYRTVAADDALLSMAHGRDTAAISVHQDGRYAHEPVFTALEPIAVEAGGRPHWGKWHRLDAAALARVYPEWERFRAIRRGLDPAGVFLSPALRALLGEPSRARPVRRRFASAARAARAAVESSAASGSGTAPYSIAPMSQRAPPLPSPSAGRTAPRWSSATGPPLTPVQPPGLPASIAGLPAAGGWLCRSPPWSPSASSSGSALGTSPVPAPAQVPSESRL